MSTVSTSHEESNAGRVWPPLLQGSLEPALSQRHELCPLDKEPICREVVSNNYDYLCFYGALICDYGHTTLCIVCNHEVVLIITVGLCSSYTNYAFYCTHYII